MNGNQTVFKNETKGCFIKRSTQNGQYIQLTKEEAAKVGLYMKNIWENQQAFEAALGVHIPPSAPLNFNEYAVCLFIFLSYMNMYQKSHNDLITIPSPKDHDQIKLTFSPPPGRGKTTPWSQIMQELKAKEPKVPIDFIMFS